ncbi:hypothetical protein LZ31DRAFT_561103 [Colletotrichum somersetense]|nr:hypothetical protein LZ31DRAFT_561103 [Colletotrichum somersetense]
MHRISRFNLLFFPLGKGSAIPRPRSCRRFSDNKIRHVGKCTLLLRRPSQLASLLLAPARGLLGRDPFHRIEADRDLTFRLTTARNRLTRAKHATGVIMGDAGASIGERGEVVPDEVPDETQQGSGAERLRSEAGRKEQPFPISDTQSPML